MNLTCSKCKKQKPPEDFRKDKRRKCGYGSWCKSCVNDGVKKYQESNPEKIKSYRQKYNKVNAEKLQKTAEKKRRALGIHPRTKKTKAEKRLNRRKRYENKKQEFFCMYGNKCSCCGEQEKTFLVIDHVKGQKGKNKESSYIAYTNATKKYQPNKYRILCHNCNHAVRFGVCPHQKT